MSPHNGTLLISDLEYPGIVSLVDENWQGRLVMAQVANLVWSGKPALVQDLLERSISIARPSVIYLSHVARTNGYCLNESLLAYIREVNPKAIIVIDGAQAIGNIYVSRSFLEKVDFYVTSGHKWVSAHQTLGIVYAHERWKLPDPAQSYSMRAGSGGTGNLATLRSLPPALKDFNGVLADIAPKEQMRRIEGHNAQLAGQFSIAMKDLGLTCVGVDSGSSDYEWRWNGLVTIQNAPERLVDELTKDGTITALRSEEWRDQVGGRPRAARFLLKCNPRTGTVTFTNNVDLREKFVPIPAAGCLRFCFHYYHNMGHVRELVQRISGLL